MSEKKVNYEQEEAMVDMVGRAQAGKVVVPVSEEIATSPAAPRNDSDCDVGEKPDRKDNEDGATCRAGEAKCEEENAVCQGKAAYEAGCNEERRWMKKIRRKQNLIMIAKVLGCLLAIAALVLMLLDARAVPVVAYAGIVILVVVGTVAVDRWLLGFR